MKLSLIVLQGNSEGKEIPVRLNQFLIGRDPECQLRPASPAISKRHCALLVREGKVYLRDFDSTNGTFINGQPVKGEAEVHDGDQINVGPLGFRSKLQAAAASPTPPPAPAAKKPAAAATPKAGKPAAKPGSKKAEEDAIADMLLNFGDEGPAAGSPGAAQEIPGGSTIMDMPNPAAASQPEPDAKESKPGAKESKPEAKKTEKKPVGDAAATSNAAKAILEKYLRRPRG